METDNTADDSSYWDRGSGEVIEATEGHATTLLPNWYQGWKPAGRWDHVSSVQHPNAAKYTHCEKKK